jgi:hypothetical protein
MEKNDEIKQKAEELINMIKVVEEELVELRKTCKHSDYKIKDINFGVGASKLRKMCKFCDKIIGFPTQKDLGDNGYI